MQEGYSSELALLRFRTLLRQSDNVARGWIQGDSLPGKACGLMRLVQPIFSYMTSRRARLLLGDLTAFRTTHAIHSFHEIPHASVESERI